MFPQVITSSADLERFCQQVSVSSWIALDTEFMRESTYYPKLCLIQLSTEHVNACIDVLTLETLDPLVNILKQASQLKIFHSSRQDLEVLHASFGFLPQPLFDTQIAASILGLDEQISYAELVSQKLAIKLAKSESRTDWKKRPLTEAQIDYALDDVIHLGGLYQTLNADLQKHDRLHWLNEECEKLLALSNYVIPPDDAWKYVKGTGKLSNKALYFVQKIAAWREQTAQNKNLPRRWIVPDNAIVALSQLGNFKGHIISECLQAEAPKSLRHCERLTEILQQPVCSETLANIIPPLDRRLSKAQQALVKKMMNFIRQRGEEINTSSSLLANRKSLVDLVLGQKSKVQSGWRKNEIGDELVAMLNTD